MFVSVIRNFTENILIVAYWILTPCNDEAEENVRTNIKFPLSLLNSLDVITQYIAMLGEKYQS
jgi:hypothetical protein